MRYYSREEQDKAAQREIDILRECAGMYQGLRAVFNDFDNKVFNVRLQKALQERVKRHIWVENKPYGITVHYLDNGRYYTLARIKQEDLREGKRIPADLLIESARERRSALLKEAATIETNMQKVDTVKEQIKALRAAIKALTDSMDWVTRDIYSIDR